MTRKCKIGAAILFLCALHMVVLFAGFVAPYDPATQNRELPFAPPTRLHWVDEQGHFHLRPFVYQTVERPEGINEYIESKDVRYLVRFFIRGERYKIAGVIPSRLHLFGADEPAQIYLAGTDNFGRDQLSRVLYGGQVSLAAGLLATAISLFIAMVVGTISGFYGGWLDESIMRFAELFLVLPWLYLLLAVRSFLPLHLSSLQAFFLLVGVIGTIGWAKPARLVRGVVLSVKNRKFVLASRGFGASTGHILRRHILPSTLSVLLTQAALLVPQYIIAEVALSFFGLGLSEPNPSWGNLLAGLQQYNVLVSYWWMFAPAAALVVFCLGYLLVFNAISERLQSVSI
jgi:peptide/nickel transport system permease protein